MSRPPGAPITDAVPTSLAVDPDGALYIARGNMAIGGEVIRFAPPAQ